MMTIQLIFLDLWFSSRHAQIFQISKRCPAYMIMKNQTGCQSTTWTNNISDSSSITQWQSTFGFANIPLSHILPVLSPLLLSHSIPTPLRIPTEFSNSGNGLKHTHELWHCHRHRLPFCSFFIKIEIRNCGFTSQCECLFSLHHVC